MRLRIGLVSLLVVLVLPGMVCAQSPNLGGMSLPNLGSFSLPDSGSLATTPGQLAGIGQPADSGGPGLTINDTFVSFIDSAVPQNVLVLRFDGTFGNRQPTRATYLFAAGVAGNTVGFPLPEKRVDTDQLFSYAEYRLADWFSFFIEGGYRWINPEVNANQSGFGDMCYGMKLCTWSDDNLIATVLVRLYEPSASYATLGTGHWSVEPGLLAAYKISDSFHLEGELRYWVPINGGDYAGNIVRYGLGLSYGQRQPTGFWFAPVVECIGWTVLSGKTMIATADNFIIEDARNQTIVNAYLGVRLGYADNVDLYLGYGRSLTGDYWARDNFRFEVRVSW